MRILSRSIENKKLVWFEISNQYVWMEEPAFEVFELLQKNIPKKQIAEFFSKKYGLTKGEGLGFLDELERLIEENTAPTEKVESQYRDVRPIGEPVSEKYYQFNGENFCFEYYHRKLEEMFHPRLAHLEVEKKPEKNHSFKLFRIEDHLFLQCGIKLIGSWGMDEIHFFKGGVSAEFLNKSYQKEEKDWLGVLHASAVSNGKHSIIFPGESGSGKSTGLAILLANGFEFMGDDFIPIEAESSGVCLFPSAISIKEGAARIIESQYPDLMLNDEIFFKDPSTKMRYLSPPIRKNPEISLAAKAIVFINYREGAELELIPEPKYIAFQKLVSDSWISPLYENVERFLDWFESLPCYKLTYSDKEQMPGAVRKLFGDEL